MSSIRLHNYVQARRYFQWLVTNFSTEIQDAMLGAANDVLIPAIRQRIDANNQVFEYNLTNSIIAERQARGNTPTIKVGTYVNYAKNVEEGSNPRSIIGTPEFRRLIEWAEFKHQVRGRAARAIAAAAAHTIQRSGNKGNSFLVKTWDSVQNTYWKTVFTRVQLALNRGP